MAQLKLHLEFFSPAKLPQQRPADPEREVRPSLPIYMIVQWTSFKDEVITRVIEGIYDHAECEYQHLDLNNYWQRVEPEVLGWAYQPEIIIPEKWKT